MFKGIKDTVDKEVIMTTDVKSRPVRILALTVAVMMFFSVFSVLSFGGDSKVYAAGETGQVTASSLIVRSGAGTNYSRIGSLAKGKTFTILGSAKDKSGVTWYKLKYNSKNGYVSSKYVNIKQPTVTSVSNTKGTVNTKKDPLTVRSGPGSSYSKIGSMSKGKTFDITGKSTDSSGVVWYRLTYSGKTGYVSSVYVKTSTTSSSVTAVVNTKATVNTKKDPLIVRSGPGKNYSKIGSLAKGKTVSVSGKVLDSSGTTWYTFSYNGKTGYISGDYLKITQTSSSVTTVTNLKGTVTTKKDPLIVRSGPGKTYSKLGSIVKGSTFTVTGQTKDSTGLVWYTFSYNGKTGYVSSQYVTTTEIEQEKPAEPETPDQETPDTTDPEDPEVTEPEDPENEVITVTVGTVTTKADPLTVRNGAGTSYKKIGSLMKGSKFTVTGEKKASDGVTWYTLNFNGQTGYVSSKYVSISTTTSSAGDVSDDTAAPDSVTFQIGKINTKSDPLNIRSGPGTSYSKLGSLAKGSTVTITGSTKDSKGKVWYTYQFSSNKTGYICSDYVTVSTVTSESEFEAYMTAQGFPESYKPGLRALHAAHPNWVFKAYNVGCTWDQAVAAETKNMGTNLVSSSSPSSYRDPDSYKNGVWQKFDGSWYAASDSVVKYYMDPRNFLNDNYVYQFMIHTYDGNTQNASTVAAVIDGTFMETRNPGGGYSSFAALINDAGKAANVNPNVLAAMIIQEQGTNGTSGLISGKYPGYEGYYNFFNVGAYASNGRNAIVNGLIYASSSGSDSRPWNSVYKSIKGGAEFYGSDYVHKNQDSYYTKKFNVKNGTSNIGTHQYMTNVAGAASEGSILKKAFNANPGQAATFEIPVYQNMPSVACPLG